MCIINRGGNDCRSTNNRRYKLNAVFVPKGEEEAYKAKYGDSIRLEIWLYEPKEVVS